MCVRSRLRDIELPDTLRPLSSPFVQDRRFRFAKFGKNGDHCGSCGIGYERVLAEQHRPNERGEDVDPDDGAIDKWSPTHFIRVASLVGLEWFRENVAGRRTRSVC